MNLGIFLPIGSSFRDLKKTGQDNRFINYYLKKYNKKFKKIFIFSYEKEKISLPGNCYLISNKFRLNRFLYAFCLPFLNWATIKKIDIIRVTQMTGVLPAIISKSFFKKPFIFTYGYDYVSFARLEVKKIRKLLLEILEKIAIRFSYGVVVTNQKIKIYLKRKYPQTILFYIPNGVDVKRFKTQTLKVKTGNKNSKINILTIARLEKQKNLESLIQAAALLKKYKIDLLFIGWGSLKLKLIKLAEKLKINLKIIDKVSHNRLVKYYRKADIFCLPSFLEGQPKVLLEAMACQVPCLVGKYPGIEEFGNKKEILITGFNPREIMKNIRVLIENPSLRKTLSFYGRQKVVKDFDINKLLNKEIKILKEIK